MKQLIAALAFLEVADNFATSSAAGKLSCGSSAKSVYRRRGVSGDMAMKPTVNIKCRFSFYYGACDAAVRPASLNCDGGGRRAISGQHLIKRACRHGENMEICHLWLKMQRAIACYVALRIASKYFARLNRQSYEARILAWPSS